MYSHHSHSGSYCQHGSDPLNEMVAQAQLLNFKLFCLTEHIPRKNPNYLYPEEKNCQSQEEDVKRLENDFDQFVKHARKIHENSITQNSKTKIIIGTEIESCDTDQILYGQQLMSKYSDTVKFCVGSVHHINGIPIDFNQEMWNEALKSMNCNLREMLLKYYDHQYEMLTILKPKIVGHFDLYKLFLPNDMIVNKTTGQLIKGDNGNSDCIRAVDISLVQLWSDVRRLVVRNLTYIESYGGLLEINTSALRKGLSEPYPSHDICHLAMQYCGGGKFVLSDDSHSLEQIGTCYERALDYMVNVLHLDKLYYLKEDHSGELQQATVPMAQFQADTFWNVV